MEIKILTSASTLCVSLRGRLDSDAARLLPEQVLPQFGAELINMELDCHRLDYLSADGLFALAALCDAVSERGGRLSLKHVTGQVAEAIKVSGLDTVINTH